jgi:hypothetical protein
MVNHRWLRIRNFLADSRSTTYSPAVPSILHPRTTWRSNAPACVDSQEQHGLAASPTRYSRLEKKWYSRGWGTQGEEVPRSVSPILSDGIALHGESDRYLDIQIRVIQLWDIWENCGLLTLSFLLSWHHAWYMPEDDGDIDTQFVCSRDPGSNYRWVWHPADARLYDQGDIGSEILINMARTGTIIVNKWLDTFAWSYARVVILTSWTGVSCQLDVVQWIWSSFSSSCSA